MNTMLAVAEYSSLIDWVDRLGIPAALLAAGVFGVYRLANFLAPIVSNMATKHGELIDTLSDQSVKQTQCMAILAEGQKEHGKLLQIIHDRVSQQQR